jgi:L-threonylcarbamoyladenylate synthase
LILKGPGDHFPEILQILRDGGLVIAPTETFYGILGDPFSPSAVTRLLRLKGRTPAKPVPLITGDFKVVQSLAEEIPDLLEPLAREFWPGPLTLVLRGGKRLPRGITADTGTIGIRIPSPSPALDLAKSFSGALTATSANLEGRPAPASCEELDRQIIQGVDAVFDGGPTTGDLVKDPPTIVRPGALDDEVERFLRVRDLHNPF